MAGTTWVVAVEVLYCSSRVSPWLGSWVCVLGRLQVRDVRDAAAFLG